MIESAKSCSCYEGLESASHSSHNGWLAHLAPPRAALVLRLQCAGVVLLLVNFPDMPGIMQSFLRSESVGVSGGLGLGTLALVPAGCCVRHFGGSRSPLLVQDLTPWPAPTSGLFVMPRAAAWALYGLLASIMDGPAVMLTGLLGLRLSPHFDRPWLANSAASWWNKRW